MTQSLNTALELQEEYYYKIAQILGYETIEKTKCTTTDDIIEKLQICKNFKKRLLECFSLNVFSYSYNNKH